MTESIANFVLSMGKWMATPDNIGFIVLAIIVTPVLTITITAVLNPLKASKIPGLFLGSVVVLIGFVLVSFALTGSLLRFVVP